MNCYQLKDSVIVGKSKKQINTSQKTVWLDEDYLLSGTLIQDESSGKWIYTAPVNEEVESE